MDEIEAEREYVEKTLAIAQYANRKYEELDEYYKKIASYISVKSKISDSFIMQYMDKIKNIVIDNTSTKDSENINVSLFQSKKEQREIYTIRLSNYHTVAKMKELEYKRKSFVGNVFKEKKVLYIPNIDERKPGDIFTEIYYRKLIIFLEVLKCRQSLMFQGFPAFLVTEDVLKSP